MYIHAYKKISCKSSDWQKKIEQCQEAEKNIERTENLPTPPPDQKSNGPSLSSLVSRKIPKRLLATPPTPTRLINESKQCLAIPANMKYLNVATNGFFYII
jgi:hypothetical protein